MTLPLRQSLLSVNFSVCGSQVHSSLAQVSAHTFPDSLNSASSRTSPVLSLSPYSITYNINAALEFVNSAIQDKEDGWGIVAVEQTSSSFKSEYSFGVVAEEESLHVLTEFKGIKVFQARRRRDHGVVGSEHNLVLAVLLHVIHQFHRISLGDIG